jgi:hypothetical protein
MMPWFDEAGKQETGSDGGLVPPMNHYRAILPNFTIPPPSRHAAALLRSD